MLSSGMVVGLLCPQTLTKSVPQPRPTFVHTGAYGGGGAHPTSVHTGAYQGVGSIHFAFSRKKFCRADHKGGVYTTVSRKECEDGELDLIQLSPQS